MLRFIGGKMILIEKEECVRHTRVPQNKTINKELHNSIDGMNPVWARKDGYFILTFDLNKKEDEEGFLDPVWESKGELTEKAVEELIGLFNRGSNRGMPRTMGLKVDIIGERANDNMVTSLSNVLYIDEAGIGEPFGHGYLGFVVLKQTSVTIDSKRLDGQTIKQWAQDIKNTSPYYHVEQLDINMMMDSVHEEEAKIILDLAPDICLEHDVRMVKIDNLNLRNKAGFLQKMEELCKCPVEMKKHFDGPGGIVAKREYNLEFGQKIAQVVGSENCSGKNQSIQNFLLQNAERLNLIEKDYGIYVKRNVAKSLINRLTLADRVKEQRLTRINVQTTKKDYKAKVEFTIESQFWL